jgi:hypothetical protein
MKKRSTIAISGKRDGLQDKRFFCATDPFVESNAGRPA